MNIIEALAILGNPDTDPASLKTAYRKAALKSHPDKGGSDIEMGLVNLAFETLSDQKVSQKVSHFHRKKAENEEPLTEKIREIYEQIRHLSGIEIELCGCWLWISGAKTHQHRNKFKALGLKWAPKKKKWYYGTTHGRGRGKWSMSKIRAYHGSRPLDTEKMTRIVG